MTFEQWREGIQAKVTGTVNLHAVFGQSVDFFTMLSSVVGVQGTYAQVNYNAANAFQDAFAQSCAAQNLPARSLDLSMVADEGQGAQAESIEFLERHGLRQISLDVVTAAVHYTILNPVPSSPAHAQILCGFRQEHPDSGTKIAALQRPDARFSHIWFRPSDNNSAAVKDGEYDVQSALQSSTSAQMAIQAAFTALKKHISQLLDVAESTIEPDRTVASYGLDSLTAMELRKFVNTRLSSPVQMLEIMNPVSIMDFAELVAKKSRFVNAAVFEDAE
jgi:emericellamide synthase (highly reducing iterative type I polyketide synthase)